MPRAPTVQNQEDDDVFNFHAALLTGQGRSSTAALQEALRGRARQPPKELHKWMWNVDIPEPVRISVNSEQVYAVRTVFSSVKSWNIHANAMKWWPGLRICDLQDYPQKGVVRHTVARMWWLYAVHRIFAQRHRQATNMMVDAMWQGMIFSRYKELLKVMAHTKRQHGGYVPNASLVAFQPYKAEEKQVKDLQLLLPLNDILAARRRAISAHGEKRRTTVHPARAGIIERSKHSWRKQLSRLRSSLQMGQMAPVGDPEDDELDVEDGEVRTSFSQETFQEDSGSLEEDFGRQQSVASTSTMAYRSSVSTTAYSKETRSTFALKHFAGHWEVNVPAVELVALAGNSSRLRLLSGRVANICADVILEVQGQSMGHDAISIPSSPGHPRQATRSVQRASDAAETPQSPPSCLLALSVDSFLLTSPDRLEDSGEGLGRNLLHGAPPEVVRVVRPLRLGEPRSHDIGAARKAGRRIRENTAVAVFAALDLQSGAGGECEVHLPDLGVVVSDLLLERLADFAAGKSVKLRISMSDAADEEEDRDDQAKTSHAHSEEQRWTTYPRHHFDSLMGQVLSFRHIATSSSTATDQASNQRNLVSYASMGSVLSFAEASHYPLPRRREDSENGAGRTRVNLTAQGVA
ncbi:unnamed protein product [Prorocentrum cordatum]|uniref:Uncharacterized protein n=1 Tax=Prorocentrum cordatum TaxID=2364126 RepID=A0ABN9TA74_9DINO|nr:unnamed protein product [Polarella glacialis]